jgi:5-deoxy-glucuronate isomerase
MNSHLLRRPSARNPIHNVTPENAGWTYVGFSLYRLAPCPRP